MQQDSGNIAAAKIEQRAGLPGANVLEVGCGDGRLTAGLAGKPGLLAALDPDQGLVLAARTAAPRAACIVGSGQELCFADNVFDVVLFTLSLHHQDGRAALREAARVLKPKGRVIVLEPDLDGEVQLLGHIFHDETRELVAARRAVESCDFKITDREVFETDWIFTGADEVYQYLFDYYGVTPNNSLTRRVADFLGNRIEQRPLILKDRLVIVSLDP